MQLQSFLLLVVLGCLGSLASCTQTGPIQELALKLDRQVGEYAADRRKVVDSLNAEYRSAYVQLSGDFQRLSEDRLRLERSADAQTMADSVLLSWQKNTTHTAVISELDR